MAFGLTTPMPVMTTRRRWGIGGLNTGIVGARSQVAQHSDVEVRRSQADRGTSRESHVALLSLNIGMLRYLVASSRYPMRSTRNGPSSTRPTTSYAFKR